MPGDHQHLRLHLDRPLSGRERRELRKLAGNTIGFSPVGRIIDIRPISGLEDVQPPAAVVSFLVNHEIGFTPNSVVSLKAA